MRLVRKHKIFISLLTNFPLFFIVSLSYSQTHQKPNVILITIDSLRPDHLGCYGYRRNTSPNIDRLAKESILFTQAISQAPWTYPSLFSILSGTYPDTHGVLSPRHKLKDVPLLNQILRQNGYYTVAICAHYTISEVEGFRQTFHKFFRFRRKRDNFWIVNNARPVTQLATRWLRNNYRKKFFLWLHYMDCHGPYKSPSPYNKMWDKKYTEAINGIPISEHIWLGLGGVPKYMAEVMDVKHMSKEEYISHYDGEISFLDSQIGILLNELNKLGIERNTLIILTSDHGESLGEHAYFGHELLLYDVLLKVPLIIKFPRVFPHHKIITKQVQSIDIMPTILDLLGLKQPDLIEGRSLVSLILGEKEEPASYAYSSYENYLSRYAIRTEEWKLIYTQENNHYELYNLRRDPQESVNLYEMENRVAEILKMELGKYLNIAPFPEKGLEELSAETKETLRSLGYLQ
jgi:arylsulfatase A-like enzyme